MFSCYTYLTSENFRQLPMTDRRFTVFLMMFHVSLQQNNLDDRGGTQLDHPGMGGLVEHSWDRGNPRRISEQGLRSSSCFKDHPWRISEDWFWYLWSAHFDIPHLKSSKIIKIHRDSIQNLCRTHTLRSSGFPDSTVGWHWAQCYLSRSWNPSMSWKNCMSQNHPKS